MANKQRSFEEELSYQRFVLKDSMRRGREQMLETLPKFVENATEMMARIKDFSNNTTHCNQDDMYKWFQTFTDNLRKANQEWYEASQKMIILDALESAHKADEKNLFKR